MANNTYTFADLKKAVVHALGGNPDTNLSSDQIVNGALANLCNRIPWRWRQKALSLTSVNAQSYIALPSDFQEFAVVKKSGATGICESVSLDQITEARQSGSTTITSGLWYCLNWTAQASVTAEPTPILELYPTPASSTAGYVVGTYLRQIPKLTSATDLPDIPGTFHELLLIYCRAYAVALEFQTRGADWQMFLDMLPDYERLDGRSPGYLGRYRGGLMPSVPSDLAARTSGISA